MTRHEAISLAFRIKENPETETDYGTYLYSAVGLIKREKDSGATFAAMQLVKAIEEAITKRNGPHFLSAFSVRKMEIIREEHVKRMARNFETLAGAYEQTSYESEMAYHAQAAAEDLYY